MGKFIITEDEKQDILNKYQDNTDDKVFAHLKRHYPFGIEEVFNRKYIVVDEKMQYLPGNKDYVKVKIKNEIVGEFPDVPVPTLVRTIKKFLSLVSAQ